MLFFLLVLLFFVGGFVISDYKDKGIFVGRFVGMIEANVACCY
jgi:hypothetical protein